MFFKYKGRGRAPDPHWRIPTPTMPSAKIKVAQVDDFIKLHKYIEGAKLLNVPIIIESKNIGTDNIKIIVYDISIKQ